MTDKNTVGVNLQALQNVIERNVSELGELKQQLKSYRESVRNILHNDEVLTAAEEVVTKFQQKLKERKAQLLVSPEVVQIRSNITELTERKHEIEDALNTYFLTLYRLTDSKTYDTSAGETKEFTIKAKAKA